MFHEVAETTHVCIVNLWSYTEILPRFLLFSAYKKYSVTTVVYLSLIPCKSLFPTIYYSSDSSVQLKHLNKGIYQFEIRSKKKLLFSRRLYQYIPSCLKTLPIKLKSVDSRYFCQCDQCWNFTRAYKYI